MLVVMLYQIQIIPHDSSIFIAEAKAVDFALVFIRTCDNNNTIIFSDSFSEPYKLKQSTDSKTFGKMSRDFSKKGKCSLFDS